HPDAPAWTEDRLRAVSVSTWNADKLPPEYLNRTITIDRTSMQKLLEYCGKLRKAGWSGPSDDDIFEEKINAETGLLSLISKSYGFTFRKGCYDMYFYVRDEDWVEITASREFAGVWPSHLFGDSFKPPANAVIVGEVLDEDIISEYNGDLYIRLEMDFCPSTADAYFDSLKKQGFTEDDGGWGIYDSEVYNCMRINGKMYRVRIFMDSLSGSSTFARVGYSLTYYPDFTWPAAGEIPPGLVPPKGFDLLIKEDWEDEEIWNDDHDSGSFRFCVANMTEAQKEAYLKTLQADGFEGSWEGWNGPEKDIMWKGENWRCSISSWDSNNGITEFTCSFRQYTPFVW
ncbi:MAG: hypothetical protein FWD16_03995, partial [Clostridia bacterium]|nr:hypothetical protein [Clostridia bacterium]